jgi:hypothetical protein
MFLAPRAMFVVTLTLALASGAFAQCTKDTDCKGDRVCFNGICADPSTRPVAPSQPAADQATSTIPTCRPEALDVPMGMRANGKVLSLTYMTATVSSNTGGVMANWLTSGIAKVKSKTMLRIDKERASLRIQDRQPQLIDLFMPVDASPDNMYLVRLTARDKSRFLPVGTTEANALGGSSSSYVFPEGVRVVMIAETVTSLCTYNGKRLAHYRSKPETPLEVGEYAIMVGTRMYDFGVDPPQ